MADDFRAKEENIEKLRVDNEEAEQQKELAEKKALIREAKERYGSKWKKVLGLAGKLKISRETLTDLHGMGMGGSPLRELSDPRSWNRHK